MAFYRWNGKLLVRTWNGVTGLATSEECCCGGCCDKYPSAFHLTAETIYVYGVDCNTCLEAWFPMAFPPSPECDQFTTFHSDCILQEVTVGNLPPSVLISIPYSPSHKRYWLGQAQDRCLIQNVGGTYEYIREEIYFLVICVESNLVEQLQLFIGKFSPYYSNGGGWTNIGIYSNCPDLPINDNYQQNGNLLHYWLTLEAV